MTANKLPNHPEQAKSETELSDEQLENVSGGTEIKVTVQQTVQSPRDVATGQASGKRQHGSIN